MSFSAFIFLLAGIFLLGDGIFLSVFSNFNLGNVFTLLTGVVFIVWGGFVSKRTRHGFMRIVRYLFYLAVTAALIVCGFIAAYGSTDSVTYSEDALIVPGAAVHGRTISLPLKYRLDKAAAYHAENPNAVIVVSGGRGPQEDITEAEAMEAYLLSRGVDSKKIIKEERAESTRENFAFSREILTEIFGEKCKIALVTNSFHVLRCTLTAKSVGFSAVSHLHTSFDWYLLPPSYLRELAAVAWLMIKPIIGG